jgi:CubicO group peptidase (beta-lactamase class C family)
MMHIPAICASEGLALQTRFSRRLLFALPMTSYLCGNSAVVAAAQPAGSAWPLSDPAAENIDESLPVTLDGIVPTYPALTGLIVVRNGAIVSEHYQGEYGQEDPISIRSVTKSVVGTLIGIALERGDLASLEQTLGELIPDRIPEGADPAVRGITVRSLLTMTSGLDWNYQTDYARLEASDDPLALTLSQPVIAEQGSVYVYNSGGSHVLGVILETVTGQHLEAYADTVLFGPLGIERGRWRETPQGDAIGGYGLYLTPRDMARLGLLYLQEGRWDGKRLLSANYIAEATSPQSAGDPTGGTPYGYHWWVTGATGHDAFFALGFGGQYIYVVPDLDLIVVTAVGFEGQPVELRSPRPIIEEVIITLVYE